MMNERLIDRKVVHKSLPEKLVFQIRLLIWKRYVESTKSKFDLAKVLVPPMLFFALIILVYSQFDGLFNPDGLEPFIVPLAFWIFMQRLVVQIMYEKSSRLQESMRMMGLSDFAYWTSYVISDGVILGFILSFLCTLFTVGGLFNDANFGLILGIFLVFCLSAVPFCFFICSFFDTPQTAGQALLGLLIGFYVIYVVVFVVGTYTIPFKEAQTICCFIPPLALQIASGAFLNSYDGISISKICGIMFADIFIYSAAAWYFSQVWPSQVGVAKPWYFLFQKHYWFPAEDMEVVTDVMSGLQLASGESAKTNEELNAGAVAAEGEDIPEEKVNEKLLGAPTVVVNRLRKTFGSQLAVNNLSFKMYANQIFALLGHNGAGKTTTISMLTGLIRPDSGSGTTSASIYGHNVLTEMEQIRHSMGVCPQHDVLFENLTVREHILFFSQLKGFSYEEADAEAVELTDLFHLDKRLDHTGSELSGGQKRKLSVAIAVCGGSKFIVLDEPTAGMDPLARRELWDLLAALRKGRTMLLTTHYMDEADILGDRVGIMSLGQMQCTGSTQFLKTTYGAGYKLIFDKDLTRDFEEKELVKLTSFVREYIPDAKYFEEDGAENQVLYSLPFEAVSCFGTFFSALEERLHSLSVTNYGVTITSLEDVFLKVGEDHTVTPQLLAGEEGGNASYGIGKDRQYHANFSSQVIGIMQRKLSYAANDFITIPLVLLPIAASITASILYNQEVISTSVFVNDLVISAMYIGAFLGAPGLLAEFLVRERNDKLRNVLTVMGCDFRAYWIGTFIADYLIMLVPTIVLWITWPAAKMPDFYNGTQGLNFFLVLLFDAQLIAFSYFCSFIFTSPKSCISLMPILIIVLVLSPNIVLLIVLLIADSVGSSISTSVQAGVMLWGTMLTTPHGALFSCFLDTTQDYSDFISSFPPVGASIAFMMVETALYLAYAFYTDAQSVAVVSVPAEDPLFDAKALTGLDEDVQAERDRTLLTTGDEMDKTESGVKNAPLQIQRLRKVFPPKKPGQQSVVAAEDVAFTVESGEIFGLLGANGAGKTTTLSMLTRHLTPTSGDAHIASRSILSEFSKAATHLGVVTQNNSLWDRLSVEQHLLLFARLRGVPEDLVRKVVDGTIDQLELTPHRHKLAMRLSGGMKRKLCVAIALIGDPEVVLLDEPSAGLDPVSRRNLWSVILRTMSHRAVILTTHSMDEAEALCKRIGIMVKGQLRALGTKQHLKNKFGSGYELIVKLVVKNEQSIEIFHGEKHLEQQEKHEREHAIKLSELTDNLLLFVQQFFPSTFVLAENGGLVTLQIPKSEMKMGLAFSQLEANKEKLSIEDYTIAQPTLEQVFIRTVNRFAEHKEKLAGAALVLGGGSRLSVEGTGLLDGEAEGEPENSLGMKLPVIPDEIVREVNKCGCTNYFVKILIAVCVVFTLLFLGLGYGYRSTVFSLLATIFFIAGVVNCSIICCACCQYPKGADE